MKQYIISLVLVAGLAFQLEASSNSTSNSAKEENLTDQVEKYMNTTVSAFLLRMSALFADKREQGNSRTKKILKEIVDSVNIGAFPIKVRKNPKAKVEDFFYPDRLKALFEKIQAYHEQDRLGARKFHKIIELFRKSLRFDQITQKVGEQESTDLYRFLLASQQYYKQNNQAANIDNFIDFEHLPEFLDTLIKNYAHLDKLKILLNNQLNKKPLTKELLLDCIKFTPLLVEFKCSDAKRVAMDQGVRAICALLLDVTKDSKLAFEKLLRFIGTGYVLDRAAEIEVAAVPAPQLAVVLAAQPAAAAQPVQRNV